MDIDFDADNQDEIVRTVKRLSELMRERNIEKNKDRKFLYGVSTLNKDNRLGTEILMELLN